MSNIKTIISIFLVLLAALLVKEAVAFFKYWRNCKIHEAAKTGKIDEVRQYLQAGEPVNTRDSRFGLTPLHYAVRNGQVEVAKLLIRYGARLTDPSTQGLTPLTWAAQYLDPNQQEMLLKIDAACDDKTSEKHKKEDYGNHSCQ